MSQVIDGPNSAQSPWERQSGLKPPQNQCSPIGGTRRSTEKWDRVSALSGFRWRRLRHGAWPAAASAEIAEAFEADQRQLQRFPWAALSRLSGRG